MEVTFIFPVLVSVLLSYNEQDQKNKNQEETDPDAVEPAGRRQVKITRRYASHRYTHMRHYISSQHTSHAISL